MTTLLGLLALIFAITVHEYSHALVAFFLGDETARRVGRLTLNPLAHVDTVGTVLIPLIGAMTGVPLIGWAKPVPVNIYNLRGRRGHLWVSLAGPTSNFLQALLALGMMKIALDVAGLGFSNLLVIFLYSYALVNISLGLFNLLPVPPLDGASILPQVLTHPRWWPFLKFIERHGTMLLLAIVFVDAFSPVSPLSIAFRSVAGTLFGLFGI